MTVEGGRGAHQAIGRVGRPVFSSSSGVSESQESFLAGEEVRHGCFYIRQFTILDFSYYGDLF